MSEERMYGIAVALILIGALLWGVHLISEAKECASKNGLYVANAQPFPVCLKAEVIQ